MIYQVKQIELMAAAQLIRANPEMDRTSFYQAITAANQQGLSQEQIEEAIQMVTQSLVDLGFVQSNSYDDIAPWLRALPESQVTFLVSAIYEKYKEAYLEAVKAETVTTLQTNMDEATRLKLKFAAMTDEDPDLTQAFRIAYDYYCARYAQSRRGLIKLGVIDEEDDLVEQ